METRSRFSIGRFYVPILLLVLLFVMAFYIGMHPNLVRPGKDKMNPGIVGLIFTFLAILSIYLLLLKGKQITVNDKGVIIRSIFSKRLLDVESIAAIDIYARSSNGVFGYGNVNGTRYTLKNDDDVFIPDMYYRNILALKEALKANFGRLITNNDRAKTTAPRFSKATYNTIEKFAGNPLLTFNTFYVVIFSVIIFVVPFTVNPGKVNSNLVWVFLLLPLFCFLLAGAQMNYFMVMDNHLVIKNHFWLWRSIVYNIDDIEQVVAERRYRASNSLRINFKDSRTKSYGAGSLRDKAWRGLIDKLSSMGVLTANEVS
jgi:hypothetical protein